MKTQLLEPKLETLELIANETYSDLIVHYLNELESEFVFGVPGGAIEPLLNALARSERKNQTKLVVARHEAGAAFMADGFTRETGKLGVCCATTGPGATNLLTGIACAYADNIPMLVITAQTAIVKFGSGALQDSSCAAIDIMSMFKSCTRYNSLVSHVQQLERKLKAAILAAFTEPQGPVHLSIPSDILDTVTQIKPLENVQSLTWERRMFDQLAYQQLCDKIKLKNRIVLFIGNGAKSCGKDIMALARKIQSPIICGMMGKAWVDETDPLFYGVYGFAGHKKAKTLIDKQNFDLLIAIGTQLGELGTSGGDALLLNHKLVHIDQNSEHFSRSTMANLHVYGHIPSILNSLVHNANIARFELAEHQCDLDLIENTHIQVKKNVLHPQLLFQYLSARLPSNTRTFIDAGNAWSWASHYFLRENCEGAYRIATGLGAMAWAIGAAVGSAFIKRDQLTICITGDGSYLMSAQEITVAQQHNLPLVILILNDSGLGMVKHGQQLGGAEQLGYELPLIDFAKMADAMGVNSIKINSFEDIRKINWLHLKDRKSPTLIDIHIDPDAIPPMGERIKGLATSGDIK